MTRISRFAKRALGHFTGVLGLMGRETEAVLYRFPLTVSASIVVSVLCAVGAYRSDGAYWKAVTPFVFALIIGGLFAASFRIFSDEFRVRNRVYAAGSALILIITAVYAVYLRHVLPEKTAVESIRFAVLVVAGVSSILCAPFIRGARDLAANWAVAVGLRFAVSLSYAMIMYAGISIALLIINSLLGIDVAGDVYLVLFILFSGIFMPIHFLSGVPSGSSECGDIRYPRPLMILITYIVLPLIGIYLAIIYVYFGKAIVSRSWPEGTAAYLILVFSIAGILLLFAVSPIERMKKDWVSRYTAYFYRTLIPLLPLLFIAIGKRVYDYGITEKRYFVLLLAMWLTGMTLYWVISKTRAHFVIPLSVFLCALLSVFGPMSSFNVSRVSQTWRLEEMLADAGVLKNGAVQKKHAALDRLDRSDKFEITDTIRYLRETHGSDSLSMLPAHIRSEDTDHILGELGLSGNHASFEAGYRYYNTKVWEGKIVDLRSCRYFCEYVTDERVKKEVLADGTKISFNGMNDSLEITYAGKKKEFNLSQIVLSLPVIEKNSGAYSYNCSTDEMMWKGKYKGGNVVIIFTEISLYEASDSKSVRNVRFYLFVSPGK